MYYPIPSGYLAGDYTMCLNVGEHPDEIWAQDCFPFVVEGLSDGTAFIPYPVEGAPNPFDEISKGEGLAGRGDLAPTEFALLGAHPNPFNPSTAISYQLSANSYAELTVYDIAGRQVAELVNDWRSAGLHEVAFDASDLSSGIYFARIEAGDFSAVQKMVLIK